MKRQWLSRSEQSSLILVFGGWALGAAPFAELMGQDDVLLVDDYRHLDDALPELAQYDRVDLIAFSFGVASAAHWMAMTGFSPARLVAVSGTLSPADAETGIAPQMIRATADGLTADSFSKFCGRAGLQGPAPALNIEAAQAELHCIIDRGPAPERAFDRVWIPEKDRIIPTGAQKAAWARQGKAVRPVSGPHVPFRAGQSWAEWIT